MKEADRMARPSPIHRDPEADGDDYGCVGPRAAKGNAAVAKMVTGIRARLKAGEFADTEELIDFVRDGLERLSDLFDCGSCDTTVKENVFAALHDAVAKAGLDDIDAMAIYGW